MPARVTVNVELHLWPGEPDGSECNVCGDRCYLTMEEVFVVINGTGRPDQPLMRLCGSCKEALEARERETTAG